VNAWVTTAASSSIRSGVAAQHVLSTWRLPSSMNTTARIRSYPARVTQLQVPRLDRKGYAHSARAQHFGHLRGGVRDGSDRTAGSAYHDAHDRLTSSGFDERR
jgi:hypothetical protein